MNNQEELPGFIVKLNESNANKREEFDKTREELRTRLMADALFLQSPQVFEAVFDGYGDSGQVYTETGNKEVDAFLEEAVDIFVTFDWYNNEGGGGDISWDVVSDKIIINGYYNVVERVSELEEAEF